MQSIPEHTPLILFVVVYLSFFLDNVLLTVVVPIIPDFLFSNSVKLKENLTTLHGLTSLSPLQRRYEGLDNENGILGALLASKAFVQLLFTPLIGYAVTKVGCFLPMLLGSFNILLASLLFAYGKSYGLLVLARALHGSSSAAVSVSGMSLLAKYVPTELRPKLMPVAFGGIALGVLLGYPFGGAAYQLLGKQAPFVLIALLISMNIGLQLNLINRYDSETNEEEESLPDDIEFIDLLRDKKTMIATGAICISTSTMAILEPCVPLWLMGHFHPPPPRWVLGAVFIPDSIGYFLGSHIGGLLPIESWRVCLVALLVGGLSSCALSLATSIPQLFLPHFGIGLSVGVVDAILVPFMATIIENKGSTKYGSMYTLQQVAVSVAYSFGPLIGGEAVKFIGFSWSMRIIGLFNILFCPLMVELEGDTDYMKEGMVLLRNESCTESTYSSLRESIIRRESEEFSERE